MLWRSSPARGAPIGVLFLTRVVVVPFTPSRSNWSRTFADQAVIAIENVRLFDADQARTRELADAFSSRPRPPRFCV